MNRNIVVPKTSLEQKRADRWAFMKSVYDASDGNVDYAFSMWEVGGELGFDQQRTENVVTYLIGEYLIEYHSLGGNVQLTHSGVVEMERSELTPDDPTDHFPAASVAINYFHLQDNASLNHGSGNSMSHATSNSGNTNSTVVGESITGSNVASGNEIQQNISYSAPGKLEIENFLQKLEILLPALGDRPRRQVESQMNVIKAEMEDAEPDQSIIKTSMEAVGKILVGTRDLLGDHALLTPVLAALAAHGVHVG